MLSRILTPGCLPATYENDLLINFLIPLPHFYSPLFSLREAGEIILLAVTLVCAKERMLRPYSRFSPPQDTVLLQFPVRCKNFIRAERRLSQNSFQSHRASRNPSNPPHPDRREGGKREREEEGQEGKRREG